MISPLLGNIYLRCARRSAAARRADNDISLTVGVGSFLAEKLRRDSKVAEVAGHDLPQPQLKSLSHWLGVSERHGAQKLTSDNESRVESVEPNQHKIKKLKHEI